jgi:glycosyltransferase involved in cell wall biosynthesis
LIGAFVVLMGANIYDIKQAVRRKSLRKTWQKFLWSKKPSISIIVYAKDSAGTIESCLDGIRKSRYPHFDIVVADNSSDDDTRVTVRSYIQKYPKLPIRLYSKRQRGDRAQVESMGEGYKRSLKGDLVLDIDASNSITRSFLKDCAIRFLSDNKLQVLHFNVNNLNSGSINLLYFRFLQLSGSMLNKSFASVSKYRTNINSGGSIYRDQAFKNAIKSPVVIGNYASNLIISDRFMRDDKIAVSRQFSKENSSYLYIFAVFVIFLQTYSMYLAATFQSKLLFIVGWVATALWLLMATWSSEALNNKDKITISFCAPFIYFLIYLQLIVQIVYILIFTISLLFKKIVHEFVAGAMAS